jgi:hypothetical protein
MKPLTILVEGFLLCIYCWEKFTGHNHSSTKRVLPEDWIWFPGDTFVDKLRIYSERYYSCLFVDEHFVDVHQTQI